ncbi:MAG TPA: hypothetical protein VFV43_10515 [Limnobacter sp.]|nr:hypothetical protein [Limnobacter sp.]
MGWFSNTSTANRIQNTGTIAACVGLLTANELILQGVNEFVDEQITRGNQLSAKAFSVEGTSSRLGRDLQSAMGTLNNLKSQTARQLQQLDEVTDCMAVMIQQFELPRGARTLNMSGKQMANSAEDMTNKALNELGSLVENYRSRIITSIETIDRADQTLHPSSYTRASLTMPGMNLQRR